MKLNPDTPPLIVAVQDVLRQGCQLLDRLDDEIYARPLNGQLAASLGAHYRHALDHFLCLRDGIATGQINYDRRRRDPRMEESVIYASQATVELSDEFAKLSASLLQSECTVSYSVGYGGTETEAVRSSVAREVMFCVGHTIHHYAILKLLCAGIGVQLPYEFGIAPSTLKHLEVRTAQRS